MKPIIHPPDVILRAYSDLIDHVFCYLRIHSHDIKQGELFDLSDAMHNIGGIIADYGTWTDDEQFRELYLRPFDEKWGENSIPLERFIETRLREHLKG